MSADFREQATQAFENIKIALAAAGAKFEDVVKMTVYLTDIRAQLPIHREIRDKYVNKAAPPASTTIEISRLAREGGLIEVDVTACWPRGNCGRASGGERPPQAPQIPAHWEPAAFAPRPSERQGLMLERNGISDQQGRRS